MLIFTVYCMLMYTIHKTKFAVRLLPCGSIPAVGHCCTAKNTFIQKIYEIKNWNNFKHLEWLELAVLMRWGFKCDGCAVVSTGHFTEVFSTSNYCFTSCSPSVCLFRSRFRVKHSKQWQWKAFSPVCSLTCLFKLICPVNAFPQTNTQSPFHHTVS